jgi:para-nitrobenzyl esterase
MLTKLTRHGALLLALTTIGCGDDESGATENQDPTKARLTDGQLQGDVIGGSVRFLKIPYAKPPVNDLRWKAPQNNDPWSGVRHETSFASPCPQPPSQQSAASTNEDCLYLNVWRPNSVTRDAPVMVWIHGGGFTTGSAADLVPVSQDFLWYNGQKFAERGIVLVSINYRLGVFGFFAHPSLAAEGSPVGNQGLLDQRHALRWVQENIRAFGGNPGNVTIFGESAGAGSVCMHTVSPGSQGLFHRAVSQSGGCTTGGGLGGADRNTLATRLATYASEKGCSGGDVVACLRAKPASDFISMELVDRTRGTAELTRAFSFGAVIDGEGGFLPEPARALLDRGAVAKVPYILGTNTDEAQLYTSGDQTMPTTEEQYRTRITQTYGAFAERVLAMYPVSKFDGNYKTAMTRIATDSGLVCGTLDTARRAVAAGLTVYMYNFNIPWSIAPGTLGKSHASEISHVFGTPYKDTAANTPVGDVMNAYWANFAKTGNPNFQGAPVEWPQFKPDQDDNDLRIQFDPEYEVLQSFRKEECKLWREYAASGAM